MIGRERPSPLLFLARCVSQRLIFLVLAFVRTLRGRPQKNEPGENVIVQEWLSVREIQCSDNFLRGCCRLRRPEAASVTK